MAAWQALRSPTGSAAAQGFPQDPHVLACQIVSETRANSTRDVLGPRQARKQAGSDRPSRQPEASPRLRGASSAAQQPEALRAASELERPGRVEPRRHDGGKDRRKQCQCGLGRNACYPGSRGIAWTPSEQSNRFAWRERVNGDVDRAPPSEGHPLRRSGLAKDLQLAATQEHAASQALHAIAVGQAQQQRPRKVGPRGRASPASYCQPLAHAVRGCGDRCSLIAALWTGSGHRCFSPARRSGGLCG